jgi:GH24 family phage-related lysozyme (muramidase)
MEISQRGIALIKEFEGCKLEAYKCSANVTTIGYGHTGSVHMGDYITQAEADELLRADLKKFVDGVNAAVLCYITQNQFDALVSWSFNVGLGAMKSSTLLKMINAGSADAAGSQLLRWDKVNGKVVAGLTRRRLAERDLYNSTEVA